MGSVDVTGPHGRCREIGSDKAKISLAHVFLFLNHVLLDMLLGFTHYEQDLIACQNTST
jgi:hypothetical protein